MIQFWLFYTAEKYWEYMVKLSSLDHSAQLALLNSDFFLTKNEDFYLKPKRNSRIAQAWDQGE
jgi:hypothetical protein